MIRLTICLLLAGLCAACVTHTQAIGPAVEPVRSERWTVREDLVYVPADWPERLTGDLYLPDAPEPLPVVLLVHGGGWEGGKPAHMESIAKRLAQRGYAVFNIGYRFSPAYQFPAPVHDLQQATRWLRQHAATYGLDAEAVGGFGYSAGAHLVAMLGVISDGDPLDWPHGGPDARLQAVVAGGLPSDLRKFEGGRLVPQFLGARLQEKPERFAAASPITHITTDDAPVFLYHGGLDWLVSRDHADDMKTALDAAGVPAELYVERALGHVSLFLMDNSAVSAAIAFLDAMLRKSY